MHIILTANSAWNIWNFRRPIVDALIAGGNQVTVLAPTDDSVSRLEALGCTFIHLDMSVKGLNPFQDLKLMRRFRRLFGQARPDAILSFTIKNNLFGALAARSLQTPFIPNVTGLGTAFLSGGFLQGVAIRLYRKAFRDLRVVFFQNEDDRDLFLKRRIVTAAQANVLPGSGINLDHFLTTAYPVEGHAPVFLMIARLLRDKGVFEFVTASRQVKAMHPLARFQLLGAVDVANRTAINAATVKSWDDEGLVEYLGTTDDVRPQIAAAHCVVLPSYREGAPRTLIEAAAIGRPLIATNVPGCRSVVDDGVNGYLCRARDSDDLAQVFRKFLDLPHDVKENMGIAGRKKMEEQFDQAIVVKAYQDALAGLPVTLGKAIRQ